MEYSKRYDLFFIQVEENEGLFSDDGLDKGGKTICGISKNYWPREYLAAMMFFNSKDMIGLKNYVKAFYFHNFYNKYYDEIIDSSLAFRIFDFGINAGSKKAVKFLQKLINKVAVNNEWKFQDGKKPLKPDGIIGVKTVKWMNFMSKPKAGNEETSFYYAYEARLEVYYNSLWNFFRFGKGWMRRLRKVFNNAPNLVTYHKAM